MSMHQLAAITAVLELCRSAEGACLCSGGQMFPAMLAVSFRYPALNQLLVRKKLLLKDVDQQKCGCDCESHNEVVPNRNELERLQEVDNLLQQYLWNNVVDCFDYFAEDWDE